MSRITSSNNAKNQLTAFSIQDKCIELEAIVADNKYNLFKGASFVVALPTLDVSNRDIRLEDFQLFKQQCKDALELTCYLIENTANFIEIINFINTEVDECLNRLDGRKLEYLIFLHEFTDIEKIPSLIAYVKKQAVILSLLTYEKTKSSLPMASVF